MKSIVVLLFLTFTINHITFSQSGDSVKKKSPPDFIDTPPGPNSSNGILIRKMTTSERNNIASPHVNLLIYNITTNCFEQYVNNAWQQISCSEFSGGDSLKTNSFNQFIEKGDEALLKNKYKEALEYYNKANEIMPKNKMFSERMEIIKCYDRFKDNEKLFVCIIAEADYLFAIKEYKIARVAYIIASKEKEDSQYPKDKIQELDKILNN